MNVFVYLETFTLTLSFFSTHELEANINTNPTKDYSIREEKILKA